MIIRVLILIFALLAIPPLVLAQDETPSEVFCYTSSSTEIRASMTQKSGGTIYVGGIRMFLLEEVDSTGDGTWVKVRYEDGTGYVLNPKCIEMSQLHTKADPLIAENQKLIAVNPDDHEAYAKLAGAYMMLGEYDIGIKYIEQALALEPQNQFYNLLLGLAYRETNRMKELWRYLIPDIELKKDWYTPGVGSANVYSFHDVELVDHWMIVNLITWTYFAVPEGWLVNDDMGIGTIAFGQDIVVGKELHPVATLKIAQDGYSGDPDGMIKHVTDTLLQTPGTVVLREGVIDEDKGYVLVQINPSTKDTQPVYLLAAYSRNSSTEIDGGYRIYLFSTSNKTDWTYYYPLIQAIVARIRNTQFIPVGVDLPDDLGVLPLP